MPATTPGCSPICPRPAAHRCLPEKRFLIVCRDFATLVCALLRHQGMPARARRWEIARRQHERRTPLEPIVAYCGLVCSDCDAYVATPTNDLEALQRLAQRAPEAFSVADATPETSMCDGCLTDAGRQIGYCAACEIRSCATAGGLGGPPPLNGAYCADYACDKLETIFSHSAQAPPLLDEIHASL